MQRLLSIATLAVMGGLGWLFLRGGGFSPMDIAPPGAEQPPQTSGYQTPGNWQASGSSGFPVNPPQQPGPFQTSSSTGTPAGESSATTGPTLRLASFNIQVFGDTKASKPYVMQELADIVNQFDIVAIQEVRSQDEFLIPKFVQLVNHSGRKFDHVIGPRVGVTNIKEQYVYLYDAQRIELDQQSVYTVSDPDGLLHREPLVATFRTRGVDPDTAFTFTLVNMHVDPDLAQQEMDVMAEVYRVVRRASRGEDDIILLGDFNVDDRHLGRLGQLPGMKPLIAGVWTDTKQSAQYDNIIIHHPSTTEYAGRSGVFDFMRFKNLSLDQALQVSDHFPVWAEFSIYERDNAGRIASRRQNYGR